MFSKLKRNGGKVLISLISRIWILQRVKMKNGIAQMFHSSPRHDAVINLKSDV